MAELTPMMVQYQKIKKEHQDSVLFFRLGDFYEMFNEDAIEVSRLLNLTLTKRGSHPMCGIPYHASKNYISRLLKNGKKIALCEQVSDPLTSKGLVDRKVTEIITPGTVFEDDYLDQNVNNYLAALAVVPSKNGVVFAFAYIDISTGTFATTSFEESENGDSLAKEIGRIQPREILVQQSILNSYPIVGRILNEHSSLVVNTYPDWSFNFDSSYKRLCSFFKTNSLQAFSLSENSPELLPAGLLLEYIEQTSGTRLSHISGIHKYSESEFMSIDDSSRKNLELVHNLRDSGQSYTLFEILNHTRTTMGTRLLKNWILHPLISIKDIEARTSIVDYLYRNQKIVSSVRSILSRILDIERLAGRIAAEKAHAKDLYALALSLEAYCSTKELLIHEKIEIFHTSLNDDTKIAKDISNLIFNSILEDASIALNEGKIIKKGWSKKLDELHNLRDNSNSVLEAYLEKEKEASGISNLKIKYNKLMGYFLEVSKGNLHAVPDYFIRKRSLTNSDRFTTERLLELETELNNVSVRIISVEQELFIAIREQISTQIKELLQISQFIAQLDVLQAFAYSSTLYTWVRPQFVNSGEMSIVNGRHPVVEKYLQLNEFIPNSINLSTNTDIYPSFALITGPNMSGKSTFLRQTALINVMAQIGCFVPAEQAILHPVDKIFCRVGASDNLARGESTFLVEMTETAHILRTATNKSLIIMDEVGRGTSTEDGLSIARSVTEYLLEKIGAKTLFATHYHELSRLNIKGMINLSLDVLEAEGEIVFLKKIKEGASANSYGVHVARLAGVPDLVINRAQDLLSVYSSNLKQIHQIPEESPIYNEKSVFIESEPQLFSEQDYLLQELSSLNPNAITPIEALNLIEKWKKKLFL